MTTADKKTETNFCLWTQVPPNAPYRTEQVNWTYDQVNIDIRSEKFSHILGQDHGNTRSKTVFAPQPPTFIRDKIDYSKSYHPVKREKSNINGNFEKDIDLSEHISKILRKMTRLEIRPENGREGSQSGSSDYAASTPLLIEKRYTSSNTKNRSVYAQNRNQKYNNDMVETSSDQLSQQGYESMTRVSHKFYRQVTYDNHLQAYVFADTNALVLEENSAYIIFHEPT